LLKSLNLEEGKEVAANLIELYRYLHNLMVKAVLESRTDPLDEASRILSDLREAWADVANQCKDLMEGVQTLPSPGTAAYGSHSDRPRLMVKA
jgi:flagellar protein FliS